MEFKSPSQIKTKGRPPGAKNKKRSSVEAELGESSTRRDPSRFEYDVDQTPQIGAENGRVSRGGRVDRTNRGGRASKADRGGRVGRADRGRRVSRTAGGGRVGRANQVGRVGRARGERNRSVTTNRTRAEDHEERALWTEEIRERNLD